jgi:tRNA A37 N6-isopentenylltransferase MiaA
LDEAPFFIVGPTATGKSEKRVTHRIRWRRKRWQIIVEMLVHIERC